MMKVLINNSTINYKQKVLKIKKNFKNNIGKYN